MARSKRSKPAPSLADLIVHSPNRPAPVPEPKRKSDQERAGLFGRFFGIDEAGEDERFQEDVTYLRLLVVMREVTLVLLIAAVWFIPELTRARLAATAGLAVSLVPAGIALRAQSARDDRLPDWVPWIDGLVLIGMVAAAPVLFRYVVLVAFGQLAMGVLYFSIASSCGAALLVAAGLVGLSFNPWRPAEVDGVFLALFGAFVPVLAMVASRLRRLERLTRRKYIELIGGLDALVWEADPETYAVTYVSAHARQMLGLEPTTLKARWNDFVHPDDVEREAADRHVHLDQGDRRYVSDFRMVTARGETIQVSNSVTVDYDDAGKPVRLRGVMVDVTRQHEAEATIRKQAQYDGLTGLPNRSLFNEFLRRRLEEARRTGEGIGVLLLDLNGFKEVNDTLGHAVGDHLLQAIAARLAAYVPERALVARLGGDEFAIVLSDATAKSAGHVAETIASCLQPPINVDDMTIQAGAACGISIFPGDGDSPAALLRRADAAMYEAKQSGRTHVFATPDDDESNVRRLQLLGELRTSISTGDFRLFHQPKVDLRTGNVVGTEGLVRWNHKQFGLLSPAEFMELSELSGLIQPLTRWVVQRGIQDLAAWRRRGYELTVALNLSVRNFFDQALPTFIAELLREWDVPGEQLVLEITESEVMADRALARSALSAFRDLGVKIAIDDFGTGFSSLSQLQQLPIDEIKVDQSFVAGMLSNPQDAVIVRSIVELGHNLGLEVVAEGAEDEEQLDALRTFGADRVQGYLISRPMPFENFMEWLGQLPANGPGKVMAVDLSAGARPARRPLGRSPRDERPDRVERTERPELLDPVGTGFLPLHPRVVERTLATAAPTPTPVVPVVPASLAPKPALAPKHVAAAPVVPQPVASQPAVEPSAVFVPEPVAVAPAVPEPVHTPAPVTVAPAPVVAETTPTPAPASPVPSNVAAPVVVSPAGLPLLPGLGVDPVAQLPTDWAALLRKG